MLAEVGKLGHVGFAFGGQRIVLCVEELQKNGNGNIHASRIS
jgi:hypothetical protein